MKKLRFVFDEDCSTKIRGEIYSNCINARFLYKLMGFKVTHGHPDSTLISICQKLGLVIITRDYLLVQECIKLNMTVVHLRKKNKLILIQSKAKSLDRQLLGTPRIYRSSKEHLFEFDESLISLARIQELD